MPIRADRLIDFDKFLVFCRGQMEYHDHYPHVVLYRELVKSLTPIESVWLCLLYMAYYDDASGWCCFNENQVRCRKGLPVVQHPISIQRRNLFGGRIERHLESLLTLDLSRIENCQNWYELVEMISKVYGNGRWGSYTTAEMLVSVCELDVTPDSYDILDSSGPKRGMQYLGLSATENCAKQLNNLVNDQIETTIPPQIFESLLCNWSRMHRGKFYLGRNLDRQQGRINKYITKIGGDFSELWEIRRNTLNMRCLGELNGWDGIDSSRQRLYAKYGTVLQPWEDR